MIEEKYQLIIKKSPSASPRWRMTGRMMGRTMAGRMGWISALALLLVVGALYGPLVWEQAVVAAKPVSIGSASPVAQDVASLTGDQEALANLYSSVLPSVVNIQVTSHVSTL